MPHRKSISARTSSAFSLIELLAVMAIIGIMTGLLGPAVSSLVHSGDANRALSGVAGSLDLARQYAVSQNTYTWVVIASETTPSRGGCIHAAILGSKDGTNTVDGIAAIDLDREQNYDVSGASSNVVLLQKMSTFRGGTVQDLAASLGPAGPAPVAMNKLVSFRLPGSTLEAVSFLNANPAAQFIIQFTPGGQARVCGSMSQVVEMGFKTMNGSAVDERNVASIQVNGLTGQTQVYRP